MFKLHEPPQVPEQRQNFNFSALQTSHAVKNMNDLTPE